MNRGSAYLRNLILGIGMILAGYALAEPVIDPPPVHAQPEREHCIIIDSDAALDDIRAIAALASSKRVVAILTTEGIARSIEGAGAIEHFLKQIGADIPVIPGESANPERKYVPDPELRNWRSTAEDLNGTLPGPVAGSRAGVGNVANALKPLIAGCARVELVVIGPWTSFMRYGPELLDRIDLIVAQGRPDPDELDGEPSGFNCVYDLNSCLSAFDLLVGRSLRADRRLRANWVDIPQSPTSCGAAEPGVGSDGMPIYAFSPTSEWVTELRKAGGSAEVVSQILTANPSGWANTSLWDDLVALYLLRPDIFVHVGGHWEPCVPADTVRRLLSDYMSKR
jgi:hypothetical protein